MTPFRRNNGWAAKFVLHGRQHWVKGEVERFLRGEERRAEVVALRGGREAA